MSEWKENSLMDIVDIRVSNVDKKIYPNKTLVRLCNYMDVYSNDYITSKIPYNIGSADANEIERFGLKFDDVIITCLLYTSDAADEEDSVDLGGRRIIKKKK